MDAQVLGLGLVLRTPHLLEQVTLRDELAAVAYERRDDAPLDRCEPDVVAGRVRGALRGEIDR